VAVFLDNIHTCVLWGRKKKQEETAVQKLPKEVHSKGSDISQGENARLSWHCRFNGIRLLMLLFLLYKK